MATPPTTPPNSRSTSLSPAPIPDPSLGLYRTHVIPPMPSTRFRGVRSRFLKTIYYIFLVVCFLFDPYNFVKFYIIWRAVKFLLYPEPVAW